ncbi:hypothetical protein Tco_0972923 [Tanacetum coccineum]
MDTNFNNENNQWELSLGWDGGVMSTQEYMKKVVEDVGEDEDFKSGSWVSAIDYVHATGGISCSPNVLGDLTVTMKDLSCTIPGTIHYKVIGDGGYENDITVGAALILGEGEGDDADLERAIKLSLDPTFLPQGRAPVGGVTIRDPVSEATPKLHEVVGKGKAVVTEEQVAHSLINMSKKKRTTDQFILNEQKVIQKPRWLLKDDKESRLIKLWKITMSLAGPNPEHMDDEFLATAYPKVHENLKLITDELIKQKLQLLQRFADLTEVSSSKPSLLVTPPPINTEATTITTSLPEITPFIALQLRVARLEQEMSEVKKTDHSADVLASIRTQVPTAVDNYLGTKLDDALLKVLERHTADLIEKYSVLPGPESVKNQESEKSPKEIIKAKKEQGEEKQDSTYSIRSTDKVDLEEFDLKSALFRHMNKIKSANRNTANYRLYHALMEALITDEDAMDKEVADKVKDHKRKHDSDDDEDDDDDEGPSAGSNQGRSTKRRRSDSAASGSAQPPPKDDDQSSKKPRESGASATKQHPALSSTGWQITNTRDAGADYSMHRSDPESGHSEQSSDDIPMKDEGNDSDMEDTDNAHIPKVSTTTWFKPIPESERPATPEPEWTIPPNDFPEPENNWANTYATTYKVPEGNKLQRKTYDIGSFIKWFCRRTGKKKLCKADLEGPAFNLVKAFHKNSVFLQYQMDECHKLLTNKDILKMEMEMEIPCVKASANSDVMYSFTSAQDGNPLQDDVRLCLGDDLKKAQDHCQRQASMMHEVHKIHWDSLLGVMHKDLESLYFGAIVMI